MRKRGALKEVQILHAREKSVEETVWKLVDLVAKNELKAVVILGIYKDGRVWAVKSQHTNRFEFVGALEQMKLDVLER